MLVVLPSFSFDAHRHLYTPALQRITPLEKGGLILRENNASRKMGGFSMGQIPMLVVLPSFPIADRRTPRAYSLGETGEGEEKPSKRRRCDHKEHQAMARASVYCPERMA